MDIKNLNNKNIIDQFIKLINLIQLENTTIKDSKIYNTNIFRISNLKKNLKILINFKDTIKSGKQLSNIKGIGIGTINRIDEILKNGYLKEINELEIKFKSFANKNNIIDELSNVIGIGKIIASNLIDKYNIISLDDLINKVNTNQIIVNDKIKLGLKYAGKFETKIPRKILTQIYDLINNIITKLNKNITITICGSYRRGLPQSSDIDILVCDLDILFMNQMKKSKTLYNVINTLKKEKIITDDITSPSVITKYMGFCTFQNKLYRIDIRLIPVESYFYALLYFTGSYQLNTIMRIAAKKLNYKLNEYGLFKNNSTTLIPVNSEFEIFDLLHINYLEPEQRNLS